MTAFDSPPEHVTYSKPEAKVLLDSISDGGHRLTTLEVKMHRFILAEWNTHRAFSRSSASSRAIPIAKQIERVLHDPAMPVEWGVNQAGMQAAEVLTDPDEIKQAEQEWLHARDDAVDSVQYLQKIGEKGVHKQIANRLLEPFMWHTVICSAVSWQNFFRQRCTKFSPLAQPEMRAAADAVYDAMQASEPILVERGGWHTPLIQPDEDFDMEDRKRISVARCARVSYLTHDGVRDPDEDLAMFKRLVDARPMHVAPMENVATPSGPYAAHGNFEGWEQFRYDIEQDAGIESWL